VVPALAVADALRERGAEVLFIGGDRAERTLVPAAGYPFEQLAVSALHRRNPLRALWALWRAARAVARARRLLVAARIDVVMGGGGYVAGPVALAAWTRRIPIVLTEADSQLGLTNRLLAPLAKRVCLAFPIEGRSGKRYRVTGRPVAPATADRDAARAALGIEPWAQCVLVFGGSLGSRTINEAALDGLDGANFRVLHLTGARDWQTLRVRARGQLYDLREYLDPEQFGQALAASDLVVARAGGSIFEIAAYGRPAILVPFPAASADHQRSNAEWMERGGAAVVVPDDELNGPRLAAEVGKLIGDPARLAAMGRASRELARPDAAAAVATIVLSTG
jgi:UDP-N-acetylglucosamine--N-acetylmuramyl-(pentapeptide) pyrophosphoryl-undecaprenol N-acetylglucosamine transferase